MWRGEDEPKCRAQTDVSSRRSADPRAIFSEKNCEPNAAAWLTDGLGKGGGRQGGGELMQWHLKLLLFNIWLGANGALQTLLSVLLSAGSELLSAAAAT
ncbi:hypothetical protein PBY51_015614 [Eleginops maclovinus]|uniref:Uncharacterized protein n=1 Tax=Eleginops maclovinus TaxID=56733 RepID=A0AAN7XLM1_ELEMC|nr:hypothetical protein PBY51_015614 [Eleginops maclovinus]